MDKQNEEATHRLISKHSEWIY